MSRTRHFKPQATTYTCRICARLTRDTEGEADVQLCRECNELSMQQNSVWDGRPLSDFSAQERGWLTHTLQNLADKGGAAATVKAFTEFFFPTNTTQGATVIAHSTAPAAKTLSQTPAALRARARRAALKQAEPTAPTLHALTGDVRMSGGAVTNEDAPSATEDAPAAVAAAAGAFAALTAGLTTAARDVGAALAASAAINKARRAPAKGAPAKPATPVGAPAPLNPTEYRVGEYKGRAGTAMHAFIERVRTLGGCVNRERMLFSCTAAPIHALVRDRAAVLDYFAWAVRNGLLVEATPAPAQRRRKSRPLNPLAGE